MTLDNVLDDIREYAQAHAVSPERLRDYFLPGTPSCERTNRWCVIRPGLTPARPVREA